MVVLKAFRYRLEPTPAQRALFSQTAGAVRFVWNWGLAQRKALWAAISDLSPDDRREHRITAIDQINQLPALKAQFPFLREVPSHCLQQVLRNLDQAFARFFAGACRHPRFRRTGERVSFRFPDAKQFSFAERAIALPKAGDVRYRNSRPVVGRPKQATVSWDGAHWQVSVLTELETCPAAPPTGPAIGIDLGVAQSITCSGRGRTSSGAERRRDGDSGSSSTPGIPPEEGLSSPGQGSAAVQPIPPSSGPATRARMRCTSVPRALLPIQRHRDDPAPIDPDLRPGPRVARMPTERVSTHAH
jgi:putative transposase